MPLSDTIIRGLPRLSINAVSSRATRRPEIEVSGIAARHSRVTSSTMLRMRKRRPPASWSWTKSRDQRALGLASTRIGARVPTALRRASAFAHRQSLLAVEPVNAVDAGGLAFAAQQDVQAAITEATPLIGKLVQTGTQLRVWRPA